jgi:hypothetical protein
MYKLKRIEECVGMKISGVVKNDSDMLIVFEDGYVSVMHADHEDGYAVLREEREFAYSHWAPAVDDIIGKDAAKTMREAEAREYRNRRAKADRLAKKARKLQYQRLRQEFENG